MPVEITMPQLSDTMTEGTVVKWNKKEGDKVKAGEEIADVETDKATMPYEAADAGTLAHVAVKEVDKVAVGALIAVLATGSENPAEVKKQYSGGAKSAAPAASPKPSQPRAAASASESAPQTQAAPAARAGAKASSATGPGADRVPPPAPHHGAAHTM